MEAILVEAIINELRTHTAVINNLQETVIKNNKTIRKLVTKIGIVVIGGTVVYKYQQKENKKIRKQLAEIKERLDILEDKEINKILD